MRRVRSSYCDSQTLRRPPVESNTESPTPLFLFLARSESHLDCLSWRFSATCQPRLAGICL